MKHSRHLPHLFTLWGILFFCAVMFFAFSYNKGVQMAAAIAGTLAYVAWGIIHHILHKDLTLTVILEYLSFGILGFVIISSVVLRS